MSVTEAPIETTVQPVTRRDVLHRAADLLEEFSWGQGADIDVAPFVFRQEGWDAQAKPGPFCIGTAVQEAASEFGIAADRTQDLTFADISDAVVNALGLRSPRELAAWNDHPARTKAEVVARLREAAEASS